MSSLILGKSQRWEPLAWSVTMAALACATAVALVQGGVAVALPLALLPAGLLLFGSDAALGIAIGAVSLVAVFGRDLAYVQPGPLYALDLVLLVAVVLALPQICRGADRTPAVTMILLGIIALTLLRLGQSGLTGTTLRQSVIGFYAAWAFVGLALAASRFSREFARALAIGSVAGLAVYGAYLFARENPFTSHITPKLIDAAGSLYAGFALLAVLFAPELLSRRMPRLALIGVGLIALAEIGKGEVRSIWVALAVAIPATLVLSGFDRPSRQGIARLALLGSVLLLALAALAPSVLGDLKAEQASIYGNSSRQGSVLNAEWRSRASEQAVNQISAQPLGGIGFGPAETRHDDGTPTDLHNSILGFGLRLGVPGLVLLLLFQTSVLVAGRRLLSRSPPWQRPMFRWLIACQLLTAVHSLFTVVLEGPYMGLFFWLLGGLIVGLAATSERGESRVTTDPMPSSSPSAGGRQVTPTNPGLGSA